MGPMGAAELERLLASARHQCPEAPAAGQVEQGRGEGRVVFHDEQHPIVGLDQRAVVLDDPAHPLPRILLEVREGSVWATGVETSAT